MRSLWWSRRAIGLHGALLVSVPGFFVLGWWQLHRALSGNGLSWVYTFEWPFFAAYAVWMWWKLVHEESAAPRTAVAADGELHDGDRAAVPAPAQASLTAGETQDPAAAAVFDPYDESEPELAAYNRYLAGLHAADRPNHS